MDWLEIPPDDAEMHAHAGVAGLPATNRPLPRLMKYELVVNQEAAFVRPSIEGTPLVVNWPWAVN